MANCMGVHQAARNCTKVPGLLGTLTRPRAFPMPKQVYTEVLAPFDFSFFDLRPRMLPGIGHLVFRLLRPLLLHVMLHLCKLLALRSSSS